MADPTAGILRELFGCEWGGKISTPDDTADCDERAVQIVAVHDGEWNGAFKLCPAHRDRVLAETTPRGPRPC